MSDDVAGYRRHYVRGKLRLEDLLPDPIAQFKRWFDEAVAEAGALYPVPRYMSEAELTTIVNALRAA